MVQSSGRIVSKVLNKACYCEERSDVAIRIPIVEVYSRYGLNWNLFRNGLPHQWCSAQRIKNCNDCQWQSYHILCADWFAMTCFLRIRFQHRADFAVHDLHGLNIVQIDSTVEHIQGISVLNPKVKKGIFSDFVQDNEG